MESLIHTPSLIAVTFSEDMRITSLSPAVESVTGYTNDEMIGRPFTHALADGTVFEMPEILDMVRVEGKWSGEIIFRSRDSRTVNAVGVITLLSAGSGLKTGYILLAGSGDSANDRKRIPANFSDVGHRIRKFIHDLNNPLTVVMGSTQLLALDSDCTEKLRADVRRIYSEIERVAGLLAELHSYAFSLCEKPADTGSSPRPIDAGRNLSHPAGENLS